MYMMQHRVRSGIIGFFALIGLVSVGMVIQRWFEDAPMPYAEQMAYGTAGSAPVTLSALFQKRSSADSMMIDGSGAPDVAQEDRKIVRTASMSVVADDVQSVAVKVGEYAVAHGGFLVTSSYDKAGIVPTAYVSVRVPSKDLQTAMDVVAGLSEVQNTSISGQDVTAEFVDVEAQLRNYRAAEQTLLEILSRAVRVEDVLQVHRELTGIRNEIERLQGRLNYLRETTDFSLLTVYVSADPSGLPVIDEADQWKPFATIKNAVRGLAAFGKWIGDAIIWVIVFVPVIVVILLAVWFARKRLASR